MINPDSTWFTHSSNERDTVIELNAIYDWVVSQRIKIAQYPAAQPLIEDFERWYGALEERYDEETVVTTLTNPIGVAELNEAKRKRAAIQAALNEHIDPTFPVGQTPPGIPPAQPDVISDVTSGVGTIVKVGVLGAVLYFLSRLISRD